MLFSKVVLLVLASATALIICLATHASGATLAADEASALKEIAGTLGKSDWNFSVDPCSGLNNWTVANTTKDNTSAVTCNCTFVNNTVCHVVSIILKAQSLPGTLPRELTKLPFLQEIDLTRNYLNGTIPVEWGSMPLVNISLLGNRISGPIPTELGNISTLVNLTLEYNQLSGGIPPELGNLSRLEKLHLTSNYLTGDLPSQLGKLTTLKELRIGDNQFSGSMPNFIQNWPNLQILVIQGSGLSGPIPSGISSLALLTDMRISDLNGNVSSSFPNISSATSLTRLILRNCNISGELPSFLGSMTKLKLLDLSFNKLTGPIPGSFSGLVKTDFIFLTGNFLSGAVPDWMLSQGDTIDLSYNNFTASAEASNCHPRNTNLFASSSKGNPSGIVSCLNSSQCTQSRHTLHINCGGKEVRLNNGTIYEDDTNSGGASTIFVQSGSNWAFSSTGNFLDDDRSQDTYIWQNSSTISGNNPELYVDARLSPLSLTYYGFCLMNGNYTVNLHFAEIMFTDDSKPSFC